MLLRVSGWLIQGCTALLQTLQVQWLGLVIPHLLIIIIQHCQVVEAPHQGVWVAVPQGCTALLQTLQV